MMGTSSGLVLLLLCLMTSEVISGQDLLVIKYTPFYEEQWNDKGSGATADVSVWRPKAFEAGFFPVGDSAVNNYQKPPNDAVLVKDEGNGLVAAPTGLEPVWDDLGSGADQNVTIYKMIPPSGYTCLGHIAYASYSTEPDLNLYRCVRSDLLVPGMLYPIWNDKGSGANADVSLWSVEFDPKNTKAILANTFISEKAHSMPSEKPFLLDIEKITFNQIKSSSDVAIMLYQTADMAKIWDDGSSGCAKALSVWKAKYCCSIGHIALSQYSTPFVVFAKEVIPNSLAKPTGYEKVWDDAGTGATLYLSIWRPLCPPNFEALGHVGVDSYSQPSPDDFRCVNTSFVTKGVWNKIWQDTGCGGRFDVTLYQADAVDDSAQGISAMSAEPSYNQMPTPAYVLKTKNVAVSSSKPAKKIEIYDVEYLFDQREVSGGTPIKLGAVTTVDNCKGIPGSPPLSVKRTLSFTVEEESIWHLDVSLVFGVSTEVSVGIPDIADVSVSTSVTTSFASGSAGRHMESTTDSIEATLEAQPGYQVAYFVMGKQSIMDLPWEGKRRVTYEDGTTGEDTVTGVYHGTKVNEYRVVADKPIACAENDTNDCW